MNSYQSLLGALRMNASPGGAGAQVPFLEFKAGQVNSSPRDGGKLWLTPDKRRGMLSLMRDESGQMHVQWKDRLANGHIGLDLMVFPEDWEFKMTTQNADARIMRMRYCQGTQASKDHFFWMQDASDDNDDENCANMTTYINDPRAAEAAQEQAEANGEGGGAGASPFANVDPQLLQQLFGLDAGAAPPGGAAGAGASGRGSSAGSSSGAAAPARAAAPAPARQATPSALSADAIRAALGQLPTAGPQIGLEDVLNSENVLPLLDSDAVREQLAPHLPPGTEATPEAMQTILRSPQLAQTMQNLNQLLASGQAGDAMAQFGIDGVSGPHTVESFATLLQQSMSAPAVATPAAAAPADATATAGAVDMDADMDEDLRRAMAMSMGDDAGAGEELDEDDELARAIAMSMDEAADDGAEEEKP